MPSAFKFGIWEWLAEDDSLTWDELTCRHFGHLSFHPNSSSAHWKSEILEEDSDLLVRELRKSVECGAPLAISIGVRQCEGREPRSIALKALPWRDMTGRTVKLVGVSWDQSSEREAQVDLERKEEMLRGSAKMAALGQMAGGIAHEILNPLSAISGRVFLIEKHLRDRESSSRERLQADLESVQKSVTRIAEIVGSLKAFARGDGGGELVEINIAHALNEVLPIIRDRLKQRDIQLSIEVDPRLVSLARPVPLFQILVNLLNNSIDAVTGLENPRIRIEVKSLAKKIWIRVHDSGPGIPAAIRERIMEPFFTTKQPGQGTGLGLSLSRGLAESMLGHLRLDPHPSQTCFELELQAP